MDFRFLRKRQRTSLTVRAEVNEVFSVAIMRVRPDVPEAPGVGVVLDDLPDPRYPVESYLWVMRRRMSAAYPRYPGADRVPWLAQLHEAYAEHQLLEGADGRVCPHRGTSLAGLEPDGEGCVTCPLHGLRWDVGTGRLEPTEQVRQLANALAELPSRGGRP